MALYLRTKKLDIEAGDDLVVLLNNKQAEQEGIKEGQKITIFYHQQVIYATVHQTDTEMETGELGMYSELWQTYDIPSGEILRVEIPERPDSIDYIKKKLLGYRLNKNEIYTITKDISNRRIKDIEVAYFMSSFFSPGFNDEEVVNIAEGMAAAGDIIDFTEGKKGTHVVDKHSIGGIAGKGVTPILVPIVSATGLLIPNTSTRAITSPAGTSDILETVMPVAFEDGEVQQIVKKENACMIWGGSLKLAPADDVMISVERSLHAQSFNKLVASIVAKKIAMGINHVLIDIPYGKGAKVKDAEEANKLGEKFVEIFEKVDIDCFPFKRLIKGTDGLGIGPNLEMRDVLRVLERDELRPKFLEESALQMAGKVIEMGKKAAPGKGYEMARSILESGKALEKFWAIGKTQGATKIIKSEEIKPGEYIKEVVADFDGKISFVDNKMIVRIARALGTPFIKQAGIYFHKTLGDNVKKGDRLMTLYSVGNERVEDGYSIVDFKKLYNIT
jgi:AMP phosphorylase